MTATALSLALVLAVTGQCTNPQHTQRSGGLLAWFKPGGQILRDGPGDGYGFPNGNPDGYGWWDHGTTLPLGRNRTSEYFFPRYYASTPEQLFFPTYYNPYLNRGQRFLPYAGCGGEHPAGGIPLATAWTPTNPYNQTLGTSRGAPTPTFSGRTEAPPVNSGGTGLTP